MNENEIGKFDPTVAELTALVESTKGITASDLENKDQLAIVTENRIALKKARVKITNKGKELREEANAFNKKVIAKEKELIAIIEPEEERLAHIEEEAKNLAIRKARAEKIPERQARIASIGALEFTGEYRETYVDMDDIQFEDHYNKLVAIKNENDRIENERMTKEANDKIEADRLEAQNKIDIENSRIKAEQEAMQAELDAQQKKIDDEKREIEHQKQIKEAEEKAKKEAEEKAERDAELKEQKRIAEEKKKAEEDEYNRIKEAKAKEEDERKRKSSERYQKFLADNGYTAETQHEFLIQNHVGETVLYKRIAVLADE